MLVLVGKVLRHVGENQIRDKSASDNEGHRCSILTFKLDGCTLNKNIRCIASTLFFTGPQWSRNALSETLVNRLERSKDATETLNLETIQRL